ncbi:MAG: hypothetical protein PWQ55_1474 [Chloroflexota bacterium]|nr:hypothetical protein [Chloroflexota bacterium]
MTKKSPKDRFQTLSKREKEVLQLICQHNSYDQISEKLFISRKTVKSHMSHIYDKLDLDYLIRDERILQIHNIYCPLFSEEKQTKKQPKNAQIVPIEPEPEPEPITPEEEAVIDADEMALITYKPITVTTGGKKNVDKPKKKHGCFKYIFGFILGVACTIGAWQGWLYVKEIPVVVSIIEIINPDFIQEPEGEAATMEIPYTEAEANPTVAPTAKSAEKIDIPVTEASETTPQTTNFENVTELNDWYKQNDVWLRMFDYKIMGNLINIDFEMWNKSGQDLYFSWSPEANFYMVDNQGNRYDVIYSHSNNEELVNEGRKELWNNSNHAVQYENDPMFAPDVTDLYITVEYLSRIEKAVFHIPVGK